MRTAFSGWLMRHMPAAPATPAAGSLALYALADGLHVKMPDGTDVLLGSGGGGASYSPPPAVIWEYAGDVAPSGFLMCQGQFVSQTTYPDLFTAVGHKFNGGVDPGDGTFKIPNHQDAAAVGASANKALGSTGGVDSVTLSTTELPAHNHGQPTHTHTQPTHTHTQPTHTHTGPSHTHTIASHSHTINHDHGTTSTDGLHRHNIQLDTQVGGGIASVARGTNSPTVGDFVNPVKDTSSSHSHQLPAFNGSSAGSGILTSDAGGTGATGASGGDATGASGGDATGASGGDTTYSTGSTQPFSVQNPYVAVNFIIKT